MSTFNINIAAAPAGIPLWQHVRQCLIQMIRSGELAPGQALPAHGEFCTQIGVGHVTMQRILSSLAEEGWIVRHRRRGSFVADPLPVVGDKIIAVIPRLMLDNVPSMTNLLYARLFASVVHEHDHRYRFYPEHIESFSSDVDRGMGTAELSLDKALMEDAESGRLDALFVFRPVAALADTNSAFRQTLIDHEVPVITIGLRTPLSCAAASCAVDMKRFFERAFDVMKAAGRKKIGVIHVADYEDVPVPFASIAKEVAAARDLSDQLIDIPVPRPITEESSYQAIVDQWDRIGPMLEGLIVNDDHVAKGVANALVEKGVDVPDDLLVVTQSNRGSGITYPLRFVRIEFDPGQLVRTAWDQFAQVKDGFRPSPAHALVPPADDLILPAGLEWLKGKA